MQIMDALLDPSTSTHTLVPFMGSVTDPGLGMLQGEREHVIRVDQAFKPPMAPLVPNRAANPNQPAEKRHLHRVERSRESKRAGERAECAAVLQPTAAHEYQCGRKANKPIAAKMDNMSGTDKL